MDTEDIRLITKVKFVRGCQYRTPLMRVCMTVGDSMALIGQTIAQPSARADRLSRLMRAENWSEAGFTNPCRRWTQYPTERYLILRFVPLITLRNQAEYMGGWNPLHTLFRTTWVLPPYLALSARNNMGLFRVNYSCRSQAVFIHRFN
jgi:hypothetical protein